MDKKILTDIANTIRCLSIDAIERAGCGHPGLPLGCAEIGAYLYGHGLSHYPKQDQWLNRDQFVLSAGHGSMLLYSCLHLSGFECSLEDIKKFRQKDAITAGHPEYGHCKGVETTTGPLGQGIATANGLALSKKLLQHHFKLDANVYSKVVVLAGDGCMMEGVSSEAASLAGHLALDNLIVFYDSNDICLDGPLDESMSEDTAKRYESYGWQVMTINGHDFDEIHNAYQEAKLASKPVLIIAKTIIGKSAPNVQATAEVHGKALGQTEAALAKENCGFSPNDLFVVPENIKTFFKSKLSQQKAKYEQWLADFKVWEQKYPDLSLCLQRRLKQNLPSNLTELLQGVSLSNSEASRSSSSKIIQALHSLLPELIGGSADLSCSDSTFIKQSKAISATNLSGFNIKYGAREFGMATLAAGLALSKVFKPFIGTFLIFSDYMKNAIRLTALMNVPVIYQFTHDSILLGEDGPTHQPVEQLASLRSIPNLTVIRPADGNEVKGAWLSALQAKGPTVLCLSRQNLPLLSQTCMHQTQQGAYLVHDDNNADIAIIATGSELELALKVKDSLITKGFSIRVISMPSQELFEQQSDDYKNSIIKPSIKTYVSIEAQSEMGWHKYVGRDGICIAVNHFGSSAPASDLKEMYGFTVDQIVKKIEQKVLHSTNVA